MRYRVSACFMLMLCSMSSLFAEGQSNKEAMPSMEFLEFLGEWETEEGEWIDPVEFENEEFGKLIETAIETENEN
jgi:hypothetical protein